jgi:hypothetical protein
VVFVVLMVELLAWNIHTIRRNQKRLGDDETPRPRPTGIVTMAMRNPADVVRYVLATFYYLRVIAGSHIVVPSSLDYYRLFFERVSRLDVELVPQAPRLTPEAAMRLQELVARRYFLNFGVPMDLILDPRGHRYVMTAYRDKGWLILPEPMVAAAVEPAR